MRNKSPLALMEQLLMVLVFALAAALCLQGFVLANRISTRMENRNQAVTIAQNAAEIVKYYTGDYTQAAQQLNGTWDGHILHADYLPGNRIGAASQPVIPSSQTEILHLEITPADSSSPLLGTAQIKVLHNEEIIFEITAAWQEDDPNAEK